MRNILFMFIVASALTLTAPGTARSFEKDAQKCTNCHKLDVQSAKSVVSIVIPDVKILHVDLGPVVGLWEIGFESRGKKGIAYIDYSLKHLMVGNVISILTKTNLTQESFAKINRVDFSQIPLKNAIVMGSKNAKHKVVVFDDPDWPYCEKLHQEMKKILKQRKDVAFYIILYPLPSHKDAYAKSKAIFCEKSVKMLEDAYAKKKLPKPSCETTVIDENIKLAQKLGISGTPAVVFENGMHLPGYKDAASIIKLIDSK